MCQVRNERSLTVCDVALDRYREALQARLGEAVTFTHVDYQPTLVECREPEREREFRAVVAELMDQA